MWKKTKNVRPENSVKTKNKAGGDRTVKHGINSKIFVNNIKANTDLVLTIFLHCAKYFTHTFV